jgi:hypothetical protein
VGSKKRGYACCVRAHDSMIPDGMAPTPAAVCPAAARRRYIVTEDVWEEQEAGPDDAEGAAPAAPVPGAEGGHEEGTSGPGTSAAAAGAPVPSKRKASASGKAAKAAAPPALGSAPGKQASMLSFFGRKG